MGTQSTIRCSAKSSRMTKRISQRCSRTMCRAKYESAVNNLCRRRQLVRRCHAIATATANGVPVFVPMSDVACSLSFLLLIFLLCFEVTTHHLLSPTVHLHDSLAHSGR